MRQTLGELQVPRATFHRWYRRYEEVGDLLPIFEDPPQFGRQPKDAPVTVLRRARVEPDVARLQVDLSPLLISLCADSQRDTSLTSEGSEQVDPTR